MILLNNSIKIKEFFFSRFVHGLSDECRLSVLIIKFCFLNMDVSYILWERNMWTPKMMCVIFDSAWISENKFGKNDGIVVNSLTLCDNRVNDLSEKEPYDICSGTITDTSLDCLIYLTKH